MRKFLLALLLFLLPACCAQAEEVVMVEASDLHYLSPALVTGQEQFMRIIERSDGKMPHYSSEICQAFAAEMLAMRPDAVILSGDLTLNGAAQSHRELAQVLRPLQEAGIAVLVIPGNHDVGGIAYRFTPTGPQPLIAASRAEFEEIYRVFGWDGARSRDTVSFSYVYEIRPTLWALMVDVNANDKPGYVRDETLAWIETQLREAQAAGAEVISVTHQNLLMQQHVFALGIQIENAAALIDLYSRYGVRLNLSGHMHMQHIAQQAGIADIATEALPVAPCQYGVIRAAEEGLRYDTQRLDVAAWARAQGSEDENLLHFEEYAQGFFYQLNVGKMADGLAGVADDGVRQEMLDYAARINAAYFDGTLKDTDIDAGGLALWRAHLPGAFFTQYMQMLLEEPEMEMNHLRIEWGR